MQDAWLADSAAQSDSFPLQQDSRSFTHTPTVPCLLEAWQPTTVRGTWANSQINLRHLNERPNFRRRNARHMEKGEHETRPLLVRPLMNSKSTLVNNHSTASTPSCTHLVARNVDSFRCLSARLAAKLAWLGFSFAHKARNPAPYEHTARRSLSSRLSLPFPGRNPNNGRRPFSFFSFPCSR
jgi:hypothetical protein